VSFMFTSGTVADLSLEFLETVIKTRFCSVTQKSV